MEIESGKDENGNMRTKHEENIPSLSTRRRSIDFHHPYKPYSIQGDFMHTVYEVIEEGKIGILESPTGTVSR